MLSASSISKPKFSLLILLLSSCLVTSAQQNSPFSRFGLGDVLPQSNILSRGMGGISAAHADASSINFINPASYSKLALVTFDVGVTVDSRTLKSANPVSKYNAVNFTPAYVMLGLPLSSENQRKRNRQVAMVLGLRPVSIINYSIVEGRKILPNNTDSVVYLYEGSGGLNEAMLGLSKRFGDFSLGINTGYTFGRKETDTRTFILDTVLTPANRSNHTTSASFGGLFINGGLLYDGRLSKKTNLRIGVSGKLGQSISGEEELVRQTFQYSSNGTAIPLDSVFTKTNTDGSVELPSSFTAGFALANRMEHRSGFVVEDKMIGVDFTTTSWADYTYFNRGEGLVNSWMLKVGGHIIPKAFDPSIWNNIIYRAGFNIGREAITAAGNEYRTYSFTIGAGIPVRNWRTYDRQSTAINTALEIGKRGTKDNNITEGFFRFSVGLNLSDIWFTKRRYD
jgi:hypothetical protein